MKKQHISQIFKDDFLKTYPFVWSFSDTRQKKTCHFPCISFHYQACLSRLSFSLCFFLRKSRRLW